MKRRLAFILMLLVAFVTQAQRYAVLEFKAGHEVPFTKAASITETFITCFRNALPSSYKMVERTRVDIILKEQKLQQSNITEKERAAQFVLSVFLQHQLFNTIKTGIIFPFNIEKK